MRVPGGLYVGEQMLPDTAPRRHAWTAAEDELLRLGYKTRQPSVDIAKALGVPVASVWARAHLLGLPRKPKAGPALWTETRLCELCGAAFIVTKSWLNARPGRYCSGRCAGQARRRKLYAKIIEDNSILEPNSGCWLWTAAINGYGYGAIRVDDRQWHAHRLSYVVHYGEPAADQPVIRHLCNNPGCVNPEHLASGTTQDNADDRVSAGTQVRGSRVYNAKLTEAWIPDIVAQRRAGVSESELVRQYGVSQRAISFVMQGITWKHVSGL